MNPLDATHTNVSTLTLHCADSASDLLLLLDEASTKPIIQHARHPAQRTAFCDSDEEDSDSDTQEQIETTERLIQKLNAEKPHRGPDAKTKPRKKDIDVDNELETINRKLLHVGIDENQIANAITEELYSMPNDPTQICHLLPTHAHQIISALNHEVLEYVLNAIKQIRRYMCVDEIFDKTERVLALNILPRMKALLDSESSSSIK
ncbi:hypothetical protein HDU98_003085, partial [Podochytrium sp. JEL0797]